MAQGVLHYQVYKMSQVINFLNNGSNQIQSTESIDQISMEYVKSLCASWPDVNWTSLQINIAENRTA